jgi:hypothetical protein
MTHTITAKAVRRGLRGTAATTAVSTAALFAVLAATAAPARAMAEPVGDIGPSTWLQLTVTRGDVLPPGLGFSLRPGPGPFGDTRGTLLLCDPPQGHTRAAEACAQLDAAAGDIRRFPLRDVSCPMVYAPVTAEARGEWQGRAVAYRETFSNTCAMEAVTGALFSFDG